MANRALERRRGLFKVFSRHLGLLKATGYLKNIDLQYDETYICPVCLRQFSEKDVEDNAPNMLTVEHAPPEASGGKGVALTCKECNSVAGGEIDFHLTGRIQEAERRNLLPNTSSQVRVTSGELTVQGNMNVGHDGVWTLSHQEKVNDPKKLNKFVDRVGPTTNPLIYIDFGKIRTDPHRMQVGLLKTAYILAFAKFGYSFLLDGVYDVVRKQLLNPGSIIYPEGFWHKDHYLFEKHEGVHFCSTPIIEGIHCIFPIKTSIATHRFGVHLPIPMTSPEVMIGFLHTMGSGSKSGDSFELNLVGPDDDYFRDLQKIRALHDWFFEVRMSKINLSDSQNVPTALAYLKHPIPEQRPRTRFINLDKLHIFAPMSGA